MRWFQILAGRVARSALLGGFSFAFVGALCLGLAGWLLGRALDNAALGNILNYDHYAVQGADMGVALGAASGIIGAFISGIAAFKSEPRAFWLARAFFLRVSLGQIAGVLGAFSAFLLCEYLVARWFGHRLALNVSADLPFITYGAPILMNCGAIVGALWKREAKR